MPATATAIRPVHDAALNAVALPILEAMDAAAIRPLIVAGEYRPDEMHDIQLDGTHGAFMVSGDRFETAVNAHWNWAPGNDALSDERSGTASGRIVDGRPIVESIRLG
jgi:hypothetical protein